MGLLRVVEGSLDDTVGSPPCRHGSPVLPAAGSPLAAQTLPLCFAPAKILLATCCVHPTAATICMIKLVKGKEAEQGKSPVRVALIHAADERCAHGRISPGAAPTLSARGLRRRRDGPCREHPATTEGFPAARASPTPRGEAGPAGAVPAAGLGP